MTPKFRVFMNDADSYDGTKCDWHEIHGIKDGDNYMYSKENVLIKPTLDLEVNNAGKFKFTMPVGHNQYDWPKVDKTMVEVYELTPSIQVKQTVICNKNDDLFNTEYSISKELSPGWITIYIHYSTESTDPANRKFSAAAMEQSFIVKKFVGDVEDDSVTIKCMDPNGVYYKYAMKSGGGTYKFKIKAVTTATVIPEIKLYTEVNEFTPVYESVFYGRISQIDVDFYKNKVITCEGALAFLNDVVIRGGNATPTTLKAFLDSFFSQYNAGGKVGNYTQSIESRLRMKLADGSEGIQPGDGDRTSAKAIYRKISYEGAFDVFTKKIVGAEGGYFLMKRPIMNTSDGSTKQVYFLDTEWIYILPKTNDPYPAKNVTGGFQAVAEYKLNLTDLKQSSTIDDIITTVIPIGHVGSDDITTINGEYIENDIDHYTNDTDHGGSKIDINNWHVPSSLGGTCYFAFYDMVGGCRIWCKTSDQPVKLYCYLGNYSNFNTDRNPNNYSTEHANKEVSISTGDDLPDKGHNIPRSTVMTVKGWNYFAVKADQSSTYFKITRIDRDIEDKNPYPYDYIEDPKLSAKYGNKSKVVEFSDLDGGNNKQTVRKNLMKAGVDWLKNQVCIPESLEVDAVDMTYLDPTGSSGAYPFMLGQSVRVSAPNHGVNEKNMTITKLEIDLDSAKMMVTLGTPQIPTLTEYYRTKKKGEYTKEYVINDNT